MCNKDDLNKFCPHLDTIQDDNIAKKLETFQTVRSLALLLTLLFCISFLITL